MTVALPIWEGRVSPVLDVAGRFLVVWLTKGQETGRKEFLIGESQPALLVKSIKELGAKVLVCGAVSQAAAYGLERAGMRLIPHICGEVEFP